MGSLSAEAGPARPLAHAAQLLAWPNEATNPMRGSGFVRPLAQTARNMGVEILLKQRMTKIHREQPFSGRVIGITAIEVDDWFKPTGKSINIRARKGVIVATGGCADNAEFRTMFDVRLTEEYQAENSGLVEAHRRRRDRRHADRRGARRHRLPDHAGRQHAQQGPHGHEVERRRDRDLSDAPHFFRARAVGLEVATIRTSSW